MAAGGAVRAGLWGEGRDGAAAAEGKVALSVAPTRSRLCPALLCRLVKKLQFLLGKSPFCQPLAFRAG